MAKFINIDLAAFGVHVSSNIHVIGMPTMTSIDGFVHNLERNIDFTVLSWAMAYRRCDMAQGHLRIANYEVGSNNKKSPGTPSTIIDKRSASLEGVLMIEIEDHDQILEVVEALSDLIESFRFSGGTLSLLSGGVKAWDSVEEALRSINRISRRPHFFIEDSTPLLAAGPEGLGKIDWLMDLIARPKTYDMKGDTWAYDGEYRGYLVPIVTGYQLLEAPREREGLRLDVKHAYAESIIGLARMRSLPSVLAHLKAYQETPDIFWLNSSDNSQGNLLWEVVADNIKL